MNVVVYCAVRGAHQMDQTGLAEANRMFFCNANTHSERNVKKNYIFTSENVNPF